MQQQERQEYLLVGLFAGEDLCLCRILFQVRQERFEEIEIEIPEVDILLPVAVSHTQAVSFTSVLRRV